MTIDAADAIAAAGARTIGSRELPDALRFSTDTRALQPGDVFVALRGERFDGHDYLGAALDAGAAALVVDDERIVPSDACALVVDDTTHAYLAFAGVARGGSHARVAAVTGSAGKTTTKTFLAQILERAAPGRVAATPRNENNEIGVAKLLLDIPSDARYLVVELGARREGEIATLARAVRPETAVVTNIGDAHLEIFGSRERLAETKWGAFASGARRVLNAADDVSLALAARDGMPATWFGIAGEAPPPRGERFIGLRGRESLELSGGDLTNRALPVAVGVPGDHNLRNVAAAAAAAFDLGVDAETIASALASLALPAGRYERSAVADFEVVYDAYNANTSGMLATLGSFAAERASRRIAVLASMAELGSDAPAMHRAVGAAAARAGLETLLVGGEFAGDLARGARDAGMAAESVIPFVDNVVAIAWLRANARAGDLVLLKGSRRYKLEEVLAALRAVHAG